MKLLTAHKFRTAGDAARDRKSWVDAAAAYKIHLLDHPEDAEIWVQLGHALKEQQILGEAEDAYRNAMRLRPDDSDCSLHLAHLLKRCGRVSEAAEMFATSFKSLPSGNAYNELKRLRGAVRLAPSIDNISADGVFIEIDDLFRYLHAHKTLSGIQRVQMEIIQHALNRREQDQSCFFVINTEDPDNAEHGGGCMWRLQNTDLLELINYVTGAHVDHPHLKQILERAQQGATLTALRSGQSYLVLGSFWGNVEATRRYLALKRGGILLGVYIYDLIPINYPEYCDARLSHDFTLAFAGAMAMFDYVLTISAYTASQVKRYREKFALPKIPVIAVPLAHTQSDAALRHRSDWTPRISQFKTRPFVLMVSTIEARKNHAYLVAAWKQFLDEDMDPPDLVFVGRVGWHVSSLMEMLELTQYLNGRVHILHDLSDVELQTLYKACLFTAFPSFVEGWGLPVGESLAAGKVCVASSTSSIPEIGGELVDYLDPHNLRDGLEVLRKVMFDDAYRAKREHAIVARLAIRHWSDVGSELFEQVRKLQSSLTPKPEFQVLFPAGSLFTVSDLAFGKPPPADYCLCPKRLMLAPFCHPIEPIGAWIQNSQSLLSFRSDLATGTDIIFYAAFIGAPAAGPQHRLTLSMGKANNSPGAAPLTRPIPAGRNFTLRGFGQVEKNGQVNIQLAIQGELTLQPNSKDDRRFVVGIVAFGYAARADALARAEISEALAFN